MTKSTARDDSASSLCASLAHETVVVVDFGSQYTQLIARRVRDAGVFCRIVHCGASIDDIVGDRALLKGIILSGGPRSVYEEGAPALDPAILEQDVPVLGICYGLQAVVNALGGEVVRGEEGGEYGRTELSSENLPGADGSSVVWMSHGDRVGQLPDGFDTLASSVSCPHAAVEGLEGQFLGLQFHPEVTHTDQGESILAEFLHERCGAGADWKMDSFVDDAMAAVKEQVGESHVICGLSGGVDSSALSLLLNRALGSRLTCIFVNNGLLRKGEADQVVSTFKEGFGLQLHHVDATERFLDGLAGVTDPEEKRKVIGSIFIDVFTEEARNCGGLDYLAQGTLYPDVIESVAAHGGPTATIKTHHNVGGLPDDLNFELIEPFRMLFKDEVRQIARLMDLPPDLVGRHPFPGPGLAVRCVGEVTADRLSTLREADAIFLEELEVSGWLESTSQAFAVLLPVQSVGVMGDARTYENVLALRSVDTTDFMTADWSPLPQDLLARVSNRIINEVEGVNRVVYDISSKPPATIEWE